MLSTFNVLEVAGCLFSSQRPLAATSCPLARLQASGIICKAGTCLLQAERPRLPFLSCGRAIIPCAQNRPSVSLGSITAVQGASDGRQQHCPGVSTGEDGGDTGVVAGQGTGGTRREWPVPAAAGCPGWLRPGHPEMGCALWLRHVPLAPSYPAPLCIPTHSVSAPFLLPD